MFERARSRGLSDLLASRTLGLERPQEQQLFTQLMVLRTRIATRRAGCSRSPATPTAPTMRSSQPSTGKSARSRVSTTPSAPALPPMRLGSRRW